MDCGTVFNAGKESADGGRDVGADHGDLEKASAGAFGDVYGDPEEEVWRKEEKV